VGKLPWGLAIHNPALPPKSTYGLVGFNPVGEGVISGLGVSAAGVGDSPGGGDSIVAGIVSLVGKTTVGSCCVVVVTELQATDTTIIANNEIISEAFIFPPGDNSAFIVFLLMEKENPRSEWSEGVVIRHYLFKIN
jgi:hypothetical protein